MALATVPKDGAELSEVRGETLLDGGVWSG